MKCMFCYTNKHSIEDCKKVGYCESGEHYVEIENMWDDFSECYNCTTNEEYCYFNNISLEYAEKIKNKKIKLKEVYKLLNIKNQFVQKCSCININSQNNSC